VEVQVAELAGARRTRLLLWRLVPRSQDWSQEVSPRELTSDIAEFGPLRITREMAPGTNGVLQLGWPTPSSKNHFIGACGVSGTIPTGWTATVAPFANLSAFPGTGNEGPLRAFVNGRSRRPIAPVTARSRLG
jgi:hypothetical protein